MADLEGAMLSDYLLQQCISKGGVADVYRARQITDEGGPVARSFDVAVKVFRSGYAQRTSFREYFMTEAEKIGQFDHPYILPFLEYGEGENLLYLVTPLVESGTLASLLQKVGGRFSATQALPIVRQLCSAVQYAHEHGVSHGNIKPSNVFVAPDGRMLLADFGIAHGFDDSQQSLTRVGWGSAEYAAPEQSLGVLRPTSDIYSLGVLFFRILTGSPPFTGNTPVDVLLKHVRQSPPTARSLVPHISDAVDAVLMKAMQKRSDERFATAEALAQAYEHAVMFAPVAPPAARAFTTIKLQASFSSDMTSVIEPQREGTSFPVADIKSPYTPLPTSPEEMSTWTPNAVETPLPETEVASSGSSEPVEWSPIADNKMTIPSVPMTASNYLSGKATIAEDTKPERASDGKENMTLQARFWKWLPLIVVILLLIGLFIAILSTFFYQGSSSEAFTLHAVLAMLRMPFS